MFCSSFTYFLLLGGKWGEILKRSIEKKGSPIEVPWKYIVKPDKNPQKAIERVKISPVLPRLPLSL